MELTAAHLDDCPAEGAQFVAEVEDKHFWFSARAALIQQHLQDELGSLHQKSVLDIGCGTGYVLGVLEKAGMVPTGCDMHQAALDLARRRTTGELICIDANELKGSDFDSALLCDAALLMPLAWGNKLMAMAMKVDPLLWRRLPGASLIATGRVR